MIKTTHTITTVVTDDLTGDPIVSGGWELRGLDLHAREALHFQSISGLLAYVLQGKFRGLTKTSVRHLLSQRGVRV